MRISSGLSGALQENMYDGITVLGTISEGRFFRVLKARIIDFGLSLSDDSIYKGCMGGSPGYSAPEIMAGKGPAGAASDIYSIGLLIRQMSGRKYRRIIDRCCRQNPTERYQRIPALRRAIAHRRYLPSPSHPTIPSKTA